MTSFVKEERTVIMSLTSNGSSTDSNAPAINIETDKFPFCIVWTPIPVLTWFFPFIGHMGIEFERSIGCNSFK